MTMLDPHLDVDQLSAAVDGVADAATSAHLLTCLACRDQVEVWRRSLGQLRDLATIDSDSGAPSAPSVDTAINAALDAWTPPAASSAPADAPASGLSPAPPAASVSSARTPASPPVSVSSARTPASPAAARARRRWWRPSNGLISAAAVLIVVAGGFFGVIQLAKQSGSSNSSSGAATSAGAGSSGASASGSTGASGTSGSSGGSGSFGTSSSGTAQKGSVHGRTAAPTFTVDGKAKLSADLKRLAVSTTTHAPVRPSTPCLKEAKAAAEAVANRGAPSFLVPVRYRGIETRAFVFTRAGGYVAFVLRDATCAVVTRVDF